MIDLYKYWERGKLSIYMIYMCRYRNMTFALWSNKRGVLITLSALTTVHKW